MADKQDTFDRVRAGVCDILGLDPARLTGLEALHVDTAAILRFVIDDLMAAASAGRTVDVAKLKIASEALTPLLPPKPPPTDRGRYVGDPAKRLVEIITAAVRRAPQSGPVEYSEVPEVETLRTRLADAEAELAALRGAPRPPTTQRALPAPAEPDAAGSPSSPARARAPEPMIQIGGPGGFVGGSSEPWRDYVRGDGSIRSTPRGRFEV